MFMLGSVQVFTSFTSSSNDHSLYLWECCVFWSRQQKAANSIVILRGCCMFSISAHTSENHFPSSSIEHRLNIISARQSQLEIHNTSFNFTLVSLPSITSHPLFTLRDTFPAVFPSMRGHSCSRSNFSLLDFASREVASCCHCRLDIR